MCKPPAAQAPTPEFAQGTQLCRMKDTAACGLDSCSKRQRVCQQHHIFGAPLVHCSIQTISRVSAWPPSESPVNARSCQLLFEGLPPAVAHQQQILPAGWMNPFCNLAGACSCPQSRAGTPQGTCSCPVTLLLHTQLLSVPEATPCSRDHLPILPAELRWPPSRSAAAQGPLTPPAGILYVCLQTCWSVSLPGYRPTCP